MHLFGTGHSRIPVEEMFPRYGSYPGFNPIVELSMTFHTQVVGSNGQRQAMFIERMRGARRDDPLQLRVPADRRADRLLGERLDGRPDRDGDGRAQPRADGVAVTSVAQSMRRRRRRTPPGTRCSTTPTSCSTSARPPATRSSTIDGLDTPVAPGSTVAAVALVNEIKVQTAELLVERGAMPPVLTSAAVVGKEASARLFDAAYAEHARRYARSLRGAS